MRWTKIKQRKGRENDRLMRRVAVLKSLAREDFTKKVSFEQRPKDDKGVSHVDIWGNSDA